MLNVFKTIGTFFSLFTTHWQGTLIGLAVGVVLSLILSFTAFKNNGFARKFFSIIFTLLFIFAGASAQATFFNNKASAEIQTPDEVLEYLDKGLQDRYTNTNGFTKEQHKDAQDDLECPQINDILIDMKYKDYGDFVCFYYEKSDGEYVNLVFRETTAGLYLDGVINATGEYTKDLKGGFLNSGSKIDFDSFVWDINPNVPNFQVTKDNKRYGAYALIFDEIVHHNMVSVSSDTACFLSAYYYAPVEGYKYVDAKALIEGRKLTEEVASDSFTYYNNHQVELVGLKGTISKDLNTFFTYLYTTGNTIFTDIIGIPKIVDATTYLCSSIPDDLRENYPVNAEFKAEYPDIEYYQTYRCNISVRLTKVKAEEEIEFSDYQEIFIEDTIDDEDKKPEVPEQSITYSNVFAQFINTNDADISNVDLTVNPVKITFSSSEMELSKTLVIDSFSELYGLNLISFPENIDLTYEISSSLLFFEEYKGTINSSSGTKYIKFNYSYDEGYVMYGVSIAPIVTIDTSKIDLSLNNVKILLNSATDQYLFTFDSNDVLDAVLSQPVKMGDYTYTILSNQLIFGDVTGTVTVSTTDTSCIFHYVLNEDVDGLKFNVESSSGTAGKVSIYATTDTVSTINNYITTAEDFIVYVSIYNAETNALIQTFTHDHNASPCSQSWTATNLVDGTEYIAQLRFADEHDTAKTYLSDIINFVYDSTTGVKFTYTVTE